jgi:hypothetical protein
MRTTSGGGAHFVRAFSGEFSCPGLVQRPCPAVLLASSAEQRDRHADPAFELGHLRFLQELETVHAMLSFVEGDGRAPWVDGRARDIRFRAAPPVTGEAVRRDVSAVEGADCDSRRYEGADGRDQPHPISREPRRVLAAGRLPTPLAPSLSPAAHRWVEVIWLDRHRYAAHRKPNLMGAGFRMQPLWNGGRDPLDAVVGPVPGPRRNAPPVHSVQLRHRHTDRRRGSHKQIANTGGVTGLQLRADRERGAGSWDTTLSRDPPVPIIQHLVEHRPVDSDART